VPINQILLLLVVAGLVAVVWRMRRNHLAFHRNMQEALDASNSSPAGLLGRADALSGELHRLNVYSDRLSSALESTPIGIVVVDSQGREVISNPAATAFTTGRGGDAVIGIRIKELLQAVAESGRAQEQEVEVFTPTQRTIALMAIPLDRDEDHLGIAVFAEDHTPRSRVDEIRRDFVANASHELKTPLGALRLLAEALIATSDPSLQTSLSERIQSEASRMTRLVDDILDLSLIEAHQTVRGVVDISQVINDAVKQVALASEALAVPIEVDCEPIEVLGDHRRLVSAIANLIENAVSYTSAKGTDSTEPVIVRGFRRAGNAHIEVEDHGIGIADRHLTRIFARSYRVDKGRSRVRGGTGLGLAIVRHVVQNHWGEVTVESVPGQGSTFSVVLPAREN
jgi:two-component system, OmpR family, sensor histidine kinase SenX3